MTGAARKFLAPTCFLFFGVICYKLLTSSTHQLPSVSQAAFLQALDAGRIKSVSIFMGSAPADFKYVGKDAHSGYVSDVSTRDLPAFIKKMIDSGAAAEFASARKMAKENLCWILCS